MHEGTIQLCWSAVQLKNILGSKSWHPGHYSKGSMPGHYKFAGMPGHHKLRQQAYGGSVIGYWGRGMGIGHKLADYGQIGGPGGPTYIFVFIIPLECGFVYFSKMYKTGYIGYAKYINIGSPLSIPKSLYNHSPNPTPN